MQLTDLGQQEQSLEPQGPQKQRRPRAFPTESAGEIQKNIIIKLNEKLKLSEKWEHNDNDIDRHPKYNSVTIFNK